MYNRYIPQPDGSYRRNAVPEQRQPQQRHSPPPVSAPLTPHSPPQQIPRSEPIPGFLRQLLPQGFDTGDLIIVLLLLLWSVQKRRRKILTIQATRNTTIIWQYASQQTN